MSEFGIAILGAGIFAKEAHLPALASLPSPFTLKAIYSRSQKSASDLGEAAIYHDADPSSNLSTLLARDDISAVLVILPITLQPSIILQSLAAGKHVISEKPVAPDVKSGLALIKTYNEIYKPKGLIWRVAENWEAEPGYRRVGEVVFYKSVVVNYIDRTSKWYKTPWRTVPDYQGGFLLDGGVHTFAALRTVLPTGTHPKGLTGFSSLTKPYLAPTDTIHSVLTSSPPPSLSQDKSPNEEPVHGLSEMTFAHPTPSKPSTDAFVITGSKGYVAVRGVEVDGKPAIRATFTYLVPSLLLKLKGRRRRRKEEEKEEVHTFPMIGVSEELRSFFDIIKGKNDGLNLGEPENALWDVALVQAALNSGGALVDLDELLRSG
ncbi:hypothetical protein BDQ17DRAFT_1401834 [Cyathus striatus]|nr:hypothetical protein BDQ17DRAFT_1401834 [Cyathus striatus]